MYCWEERLWYAEVELRREVMKRDESGADNIDVSWTQARKGRIAE
jgi:hypothetical protein